MPNIRQYDAGNLGLQPSETGVEATAATARRVGMFYNQRAGATEQLARTTERLGQETGALGDFEGHLLTNVGQRAGSAIEAGGTAAVQYVAHKEISAGAANLATLHSKLTDQWNDTVKNADPNDSSVAPGFREKVLEPSLDKFKEAFNTEPGQRWAEARVEALRNHFVEHTTADMASLAADAVHTNWRQTANAWATTAGKDASSVPYLMDTVDSTAKGIVGSSPNLKGVAASKVLNEITQKAKEDIVRAAAYSIATKTGSEKAVEDFISRWPGFVNGMEAKQLAKAAASQNRADLIQQKTLESYQIQQQERAATKARSEAWTNNVTFEPGTLHPIINPDLITQTMDTVKKYPEAGTEHARAVINWAEAQADRKEVVPHSNPDVLKNLQTQIFDSTISPDKLEMNIMKAHGIDKSITDADFHNYMGMAKLVQEAGMKGPLWQDTMASVKGQLGTDPKGDEAFGKFVSTFLPEYSKQVRAGTLPPNALNLNDPNSMISQSLSQFKRSPAQMFQDRLMHGLVPSGVSPIPAKPTGFESPPVRVKTQAEAEALKPGTHYVRPDGREMIR